MRGPRCLIGRDLQYACPGRVGVKPRYAALSSTGYKIVAQARVGHFCGIVEDRYDAQALDRIKHPRLIARGIICGRKAKPDFNKFVKNPVHFPFASLGTLKMMRPSPVCTSCDAPDDLAIFLENDQPDGANWRTSRLIARSLRGREILIRAARTNQAVVFSQGFWSEHTSVGETRREMKRPMSLQ